MLVLYAACRVRQNCFCVVFFFQVFYDFFFPLCSFYPYFFAVEKGKSTDNIGKNKKKKSVQSVDMKQAKFDGSM